MSLYVGCYLVNENVSAPLLFCPMFLRAEEKGMGDELPVIFIPIPIDLLAELERRGPCLLSKILAG